MTFIQTLVCIWKILSGLKFKNILIGFLLYLYIYIFSNCERPTILLVATKVDSPEQILSADEEKSILKNSMDLLNKKAKVFLLFDNVCHTSASASSNIENIDNIRKLLCSLSERSTSIKGFFVPHNWEIFGKCIV